jgi:hypothetical protein
VSVVLGSMSFTSGVRAASAIINTSKFCQILVENLTDETKPNWEDVRKIIEGTKILITIIECGEFMDEYSVVHCVENPKTIFLNPLLLMQALLAERRGETSKKMDKYALFIAVKIIHEFSHLIHPLISPMHRTQVEKKSLGGLGKRRMMTPQRSKGGANFSDYGEMVEFDMCGGIVEIYSDSHQPRAYCVEDLILYKYPQAHQGNLVLVADSIDFEIAIGDDLSEMKFELSPDLVDKPYKGSMGQIPVEVQFSSVGDNNVVKLDLGEEGGFAEERISHPTF